ncbi:hypothetical protein WOSG25_050420 [Weissella oryzae SG25]|uniref:Uncharacterized protein n=1 Tax=Weissella oryzae (strain DSM 25784 / JCM 18191 / LMG 30913 / SG25) TaxID=1329250 RepID=A0A069CSL3_WEIOS|nr:hypothetical protein [Weissella oryzae]GAK30770.1 hypothetical protein WOSG25_050420 [Weissella oryzae SG25]
MNEFEATLQQRQDIINKLHADFVFLIRNEWFSSTGIFNSVIGPLSDRLHNLTQPSYEYFDDELAEYVAYLKDNHHVLVENPNLIRINVQIEMINKYFQRLGD